jgi:hypothetical protein
MMTPTPQTENSSTGKGYFSARGSAGRGSPLPLRLSTTMFGLGIVAVLAFVPIQSMLPTSGVEAVTNTHLIALSSPIDGEVRSLPEFGASFARGDLLVHIINERADRSRVDNLAHEIERLDDDRPGIAARLANARLRLTDLTERLRLFAEARTLQL